MHGLAVPLFALQSGNSPGGKFNDLIPLIDLCAEVGFEMIQLLPLNDRGQMKSPYSALSAFALSPEYLQLDGETFSGQSVEEFCKKHPWVETYARFRTLKEKHQWTPWETWPDQIAPDEQVHYHIWIQQKCFEQFARVSKYARDKGVKLKGDIPIQVARESADVWASPDMFNLEVNAGAPPDHFCPEGQDWSFPIYNWDEQKNSNWIWWKMRLKVAEEFYDYFRLDHIVGFFRTWSIPRGSSPNAGSYPGTLTEWIANGRERLQMIQSSTTMTPIGEDLGNVPAEAREVITQIGIAGTRVMRWERNWLGDQKFIPIDQYTPLTMTTLSTHDLEPFYLWWKYHPKDARALAEQKSWQYSPEISTDQLKAVLKDAHTTSSQYHINPLQEYLPLFPELNWKNPDESRINIPGTENDTNWTCRYPFKVEELLVHDGFKSLLRELAT